MRSFSIIVAALNEGKNLEDAVREITQCFGKLGVEYEILVFNDHSEDGTGAVADALASADNHVRVFHNPKRLNIGGIFKAGIREARYEYCLLLPGDNEAEVEEVARGVQYLDQVDLVASYTVNQEIRSPLRRFLSRNYTQIVNFLFSTNFRYTNGSNICRTALLRGIQIRTDGFSYQTEALVKLIRQGVNFAECGICIRQREHGKSTALALRNWVKVIRAISALWWDVRVANRSRYCKLGRKLNATTPGSAAILPMSAIEKSGQ